MRMMLLAAALLVPLAVVGAAAVVELPGERAIKTRLGFDYDAFPYGVCVKEPGRTGDWPWRTEQPMTSLRDEARAAVVGDDVYLVGGVGSPTPQGGATVATFERFDLESGRYERLANLPLPLDHAGVVAHGGGVYVIGGLTGAGTAASRASDRVFRYDIAQARWEELPRLREARGAHGVALVGDTIFVVGGRQSRSFDAAEQNVGVVEAFDTRAVRWRNVSVMPEPREHLGVAPIGGTVYVYAGRLPDGTPTTRLDAFDTVTGEWTRLADGPVATSGFDLVAFGGVLHAAGGEQAFAGRVLGGAWLYAPGTDRWEETTGLPTPLHGYASAVHDGRLFVFGGSTCPGLDPTTAVASRELSTP